MAWFSSQTEHTSMTFNGNSFLGCLLVHLGHKMARDLSAFSCFLLIFMVSICKSICNISLLKSSNMFPISFFMDVVEGEELAKP